MFSNFNKFILIIILITFGVTIVSNPSKKDEFLEYSVTNICEHLKEPIPNTACKGLVLLNKDLFKHTVDVTTHKTNYVVFTVYKTSGFGVEITTLGMFGNFKVISVD